MRLMYTLVAVLGLALVHPVLVEAQQVPMGADQGEDEHVAPEDTRLLQLQQLIERERGV